MTSIRNGEYIMYSITSWKRILRVKLLYRRAFVYSLKVVTKYSQHLIENLTILAVFHVKTDIVGDNKSII